MLISAICIVSKTSHPVLFIQPPTFGGMQHTFQSNEKVVHFTTKYGDIFQVWWVRGNSLFSFEMT